MPAQYKALWSTPGGGNGFTVLHFTTAGSGGVAQQIAADTESFFDDFVGALPNDVTIDFDDEVLDLGEDGSLVAVYGVTPPTTVTGTGAGEFSRAAGARLDWQTGAIVGGRRFVGRTFLVPVHGSVWDVNGLLDSSFISAANTSCANFITATSANRPLRIWSRTHQVSHVVTSGSCPAKGAILRGRRD